MTRIEKSEAQLNAEAEARRRAPVEDTQPAAPLEALIAFHRQLFAADLHIERLSTETPPVFVDPQTGERSADPMSRLGPTLSYPLTAYLSASPMFPWQRGYSRMRLDCRRTHTRGHHERKEWRGSLCGSLVSFTVRRGYAFDRACFELFVSPERAERTLRSALRAVEAVIDDVKARQTGVTYEGQWPAEPAHVHHAVPGAHAAECPHPECVARRAA